MHCDKQSADAANPDKTQVKPLVKYVLVTHECIVKWGCCTARYHKGDARKVKFTQVVKLVLTDAAIIVVVGREAQIKYRRYNLDVERPYKSYYWNLLTSGHIRHYLFDLIRIVYSLVLSFKVWSK